MPEGSPTDGPAPAAPPARVAIVVSRYNASITDALLRGAVAEYVSRGGHPESLAIYHAPGAYELPAISLAAARTGRFAAVVAVGCLIRGETRHDRYIAESVAQGLMTVSLQTGLPIAFGVLTVETPDQALARAGGRDGNKGAEAMSAALDAAAAIATISEGSPAAPTPARRPLPDKAARASGLPA